MRALLRSMLAGLGFQRMFDAGDFVAAVATLREQAPDILLTDWVGVDGRSAGEELVRYVRDPNNGSFTALPVIMVSAYSEAFRVRRALQLGVDDYLRKPVSAGVLQQRISRALSRPRTPAEPPVQVGRNEPAEPGYGENTVLI